MRVLVVTPPEPFISLDEVKEFLRVDHSDHDTLLGTHIGAACAELDGPTGWLGRAIGLQTLELRADDFSSDEFDLPFPEIIDVTSVKYLDADGAEQTIDAADYELAGTLLRRAYDITWPSPRSHAEVVRIRYRAGYQTTVPDDLKSAAMLHVKVLYDQPEGADFDALEMARHNLAVRRKVWRA